MAKKTIFGTREWAKYNANACSGCSHGCHYCYAKTSAISRGQKTVDNWTEEVPFSKAPDKKWYLKDGTIMFPTTHDISPGNLVICLKMLQNILKPGNNVLIVSKPHEDCIKQLCDSLAEYKDSILFRFTIGSADDSVLKLWEPNAPCFDERLRSLIYAFENGFKTSVSCEPMLDENIDQVIVEVGPYVTDAIWLGKMNYPYKRLRTNGAAHMIEHAKRLMNIWNDKNVLSLYDKYKYNQQIKWKESIKKVVGLEVPTEAGLDE